VPEVAAVAVNWNDAGSSLRCLESVRAAAPGTTLVLVDNDSDEDPRPGLRARLPGALALRLDRNLGYAGGCNAGARLAFERGATHVLLLNNDATIDPGTIPALLAAAERHPRAILAPKIVYSDRPELVWSAGGEVFGTLFQTLHLGKDEPADAPLPERRVRWATGCALFVGAATFERVGPLDPGYFLYLEDTDWCLRAARLGVETWFVPDAVVRHEVSRTLRSPSLSPHVRYYAYRNQYRLALRHAPAWSRPLVVADALYTLARAGARSLVTPARRHDAYYHARTRGVVDFLLGRSGPMSAVGL
jgi:GT2 family glycosyltransferase